ncbi:MAG: DNA gyrase subunit A [Candidatus Micrarchaeaceae archaeon]
MGAVLETSIEKEMQTSYVDYAMSVIVGRALPDARDGLKPAQRRILYAMYKLGNLHNSPTKKSARIVGEVIGKYHPHGDAAVYETMVRMAQNFSMNHILVEGQGNMGSIDGDPPAAQRYTEVRLTRLAEEMLEDINKEAVEFVPNFDNTENEPIVLPSKFPNALVNGASGIAVGVATNILPHNLSEVCDAICTYIDKPDISIEELAKIIKGPDFPTGGSVFYTPSLFESYKIGRGSVIVRGKVKQEEEGNRTSIIINEIPFTINKAMLTESIAVLVRDKKLIGVTDVRDESGKEGIRIVIDIKKDTNPEYVINTLYKHTQLQITLPAINIAVIGNKLLTLNLRNFLKIFVDHRFQVITNRTKYDLHIAEDRKHIVEGLITALENIEPIIELIKKSTDSKVAKESLMQRYSLSEKQALAILDMKLSKLTSLEIGSIKSEYEDLKSKISSYKEMLANSKMIYEVIKDETAAIKSKYGRPRRTEILQDTGAVNTDIEDLINDEDTTIILTNGNYIKRTNPRLYKQQSRGGKGVIAINLKESDRVKQMLDCRTKDLLILFTSDGRAYWCKAYSIPEGDRYFQGKPIVNIIESLGEHKVERIIRAIDIEGKFIVFLTKNGRIKKVRGSKFLKQRSTGIKAISLNESDTIADICISDGNSEIFIATANGRAIRFKETDVRPMSRVAYGIRGIRLKKDDYAVSLVSAKSPASMIFSVSSSGYGKVTELEKYRLQKRGGSGVLNMKLKGTGSRVVKAILVEQDGTASVLSSDGISIQFSVNSIRITGRAASGVRLIKLSEGASVVDVQCREIKQDEVNE